jgi:threonyl-tRNA synthetase
MLVIGDREVEVGQLAVRMRSGEDLGAISVESFTKRIQEEIRRHE